MQIIGFETLLDRDTLLEQFFWKRIAENRMPQEVFTPFEVDTINGERLKLNYLA